MDRPDRDPILWRCRRGFKELDLMLERFATECYPTSLADQRRAFERLLELPDPVLVDLLLAPARADGSRASAWAGGDCAAGGPGGSQKRAPEPDIAEIAALVADLGRR